MRKNLFILLSYIIIFSSTYLNANKAQENYAWGMIRHAQSDTCLQGAKDSLSFKKCNKMADGQHWLLSAEGLLRHRLENGELSDQCLGALSPKLKLDTKLAMKSCDKSKNNEWETKALSSPDGLFLLKSRAASQLCASLDARAEALIFNNCSETDSNQVFELAPNYAFAESYLYKFAIPTDTWMHNIYKSKSNTALKDIIIPGTHDSGTHKGFSAISTTQNKNIYDQLRDGIRYIDLRIGENNNIIHGLEKGEKNTLSKALKDIADFARSHPQEIIFVDMHETPSSKNGLKDLEHEINNSIKPHLLTNKIGADFTFEKAWSAQKNIVLLIREYDNFNSATNSSLKSSIWNKKLGKIVNFADTGNKYWAELWPDSTDFSVIYRKNLDALENRNKNKFLMTQLLRTPRIGDAIAAVLGIRGSPGTLISETTADGIFALQINKWVYDWAVKKKLPVNFVNTDFYERTQLVQTIILLNYLKANNL